MASLPSALWRQLGLVAGDRVRVAQGGASATLPAKVDESLAANAVRVPAGHADTASLGPMFGPITVEKA
jgi:NADH-quinone oxidoreductase subunit G